MRWKHWLRWVFSANYRREDAWRKNHYRILVERPPLKPDEGKEIHIQNIKSITSTR